MRFIKDLFLCVALFLAVPAVADVASIAPSALQCEYEASPVLDIQNPRLSWINLNAAQAQGVEQTAYRIRVATSPDFAQTVWDTGKVTSAESAFIT